jgi:short-subunit dehydrogenase
MTSDAGPGDPRHILLTGASSGIGAALARRYARSGRRLSLLVRDVARGETVALDCRSAGAEVDCETGDVTNTSAIQEWVTRCDDRMPVDLVIANAGIGGKAVIAPRTGETPATAALILSTNILGVTNTVIPILPRFVARGRGQVAIMSSLAAYVALPNSPLYCASKAAVRVYGQGLRRLLAPSGVGVTVICPGFVATPMSASIPMRLPFLWTAERAARYIENGLARGRGEIVFPWPLAALARFATVLPSFMIEPILNRMHDGGADT